jgi:hypothetical protein
MSKSVICIAPNEASASRIVDGLKQAGFPDDRISALFPDKSASQDFAHEKSTKAPEGATAGASAGGVLGGGVGLLAGLGLLAIPGVGPFLAAGPIMGALGGAAVGATVGGIAGALVGMGIPEFEAKRYEGRIEDGNILIAVHAEDSDEIDAAKEVFENLDAEDISVASEAGVPDDREANGDRHADMRDDPHADTRTDVRARTPGRASDGTMGGRAPGTGLNTPLGVPTGTPNIAPSRPMP